MKANPLRILFHLTIAWGVATIWLAPHPPMIDLPQHAGQVWLFRELLLGHPTPWDRMLELTLFNPYMIGYGLALPLSLFLPVAAALKALLSLAYIAFVTVLVLLRRRFGGDARLDWLFACSFFGFAYEWGFLTFLVAAPVGLLFIFLAERYSTSPSARHGMAMVMMGIVVLLSHGLTFLFACGSGAALTLVRAPDWRRAVVRLLPFALLGAISAVFLYSLRLRAAGFPITPTVPAVNWHFGIRYELLSYTFGMIWSPWLAAASLAFLVAPWMMGLRMDFRRSGAWPFSLVVATILAFVPHFVVETAFTYQRFAMFLLPAYALLFSAHAPPSGSVRSADWRGSAASILMAAVCWALLGASSARTWAFGKEAAEFDHLAATIQPGQRAVALVYERASEAAGGRTFYTHYPSWYQAERGGFVDFNFAWFWGVIVRFRPDTISGVYPDIAWKPERFDWQRQRGDEYRYFFVRRERFPPVDPFKGAPCKPALLAQNGNWMVYERSTCAPPSGTR